MELELSQNMQVQRYHSPQRSYPTQTTTSTYLQQHQLHNGRGQGFRAEAGAKPEVLELLLQMQ